MMDFPDFNEKPKPSLVTLVYVIYALHGISAITGLLSPAFIVTAFLTGWPSILALVLSYIKRSDAEGTYLYTHFEWLISTFWKALVWLIVAALLMITVIAFFAGVIVLMVVGIWVLYRLLKGILALIDEQAMST